MLMIRFVILELISHSHLQENYTDFIYIYSLHKQCGELYSYIYVFIHTWGVVCVWRRCACADDSATEPSLFVDKRSGGVRRAVLFSVFLFCFVRFSACGETSRVHSVRTRRVDVWSKQIIKTFVFYFVFFTKQVFDLFSAVYCCIRLNINNTPRCCLPLLCTVKFCALICVPFVIISQTTKITLSLLCQKVNVYFSTIFTRMLNSAF